MSIHKTKIAIALAALLTAAPAAYAQSETQPGSTAVDAAMIENFATAYAEILTLQQEFSQKLQDIKDNDKAQALQQRVQSEMIQVVEDNDLSVQDYNAVVALIQQDPALRERIMEQVESK
jgi:Spy/CpxP family protein refolding chaperone